MLSRYLIRNMDRMWYGYTCNSWSSWMRLHSALGEICAFFLRGLNTIHQCNTQYGHFVSVSSCGSQTLHVHHLKLIRHVHPLALTAVTSWTDQLMLRTTCLLPTLSKLSTFSSRDGSSPATTNLILHIKLMLSIAFQGKECRVNSVVCVGQPAVYVSDHKFAVCGIWERNVA